MAFCNLNVLFITLKLYIIDPRVFPIIWEYTYIHGEETNRRVLFFYMILHRDLRVCDLLGDRM